MIPRLHERTHFPHGTLSEVLGFPDSLEHVLPETVVVAHWPGLDHCTGGEQKTWTAALWAEHLDENPYMHYAFTAGPDDDRRAIFHLSVRLHPDDRELTVPEWAEVAHRLARTAGIETPGQESGCRWVALRDGHGRLDLLANLIRHDGTWHTPPVNLPRRITEESRRLEQDLRLISPHTTRAEPAPTRPAPTAAAPLASLVAQLADEKTVRWPRSADSSSTPPTSSPAGPAPSAPTRRTA